MSLDPELTHDCGHLLIGSSLAMAEMTTLVAAIYRKYRTTTKGDFDVVSPGITGRYEVFYDETCRGMRVGLLVPVVRMG